MITIRYADLPEGLHAQAVTRGRRTIIYLRPGLTPEQRRHGLRRARQSARMGHGPRLPVFGVAVAVAGDVAVSTLRNAGAAVRSHVLGFLMLAAGTVAAVVCYALFVTVSLRLMLPPGGGPPVLPSLPPAATPIHAHIAASPAARGGMKGGRPGMGPAWTPSARPTTTRPSPRTSSASPAPSATAAPQPSPASTAPPTPLPLPLPSGSGSRAPSPSPSPSDLCLELFGICL
jgi:hypothetical protein